MSNNVNLIIDAVIAKMSDKLDNDQLTFLEATLLISFRGFKVERECTAVATVSHDWDYYIPRFRATKRLKNCAESTLKQYEYAINKLREYVNKAPQEITDNDIKLFLALYGDKVSACTKRKPSKTYLNNLRNQLSAYFDWMQEEGYISRNPCKAVPNIKVPKVIRHAYSGEDMERLKDAAKSDRDKALIYFLDATGVRISEAVSIDREQINWNSRSLIFYGTKGKAERQVFFTEECAYWLKRYLDGRADNNPALFVTTIKPHNRLTKSGAEFAIKTLGKQVNVHSYPHRFRRTMITRNAKRGMSIQEIQMLAGHTNPQTTQIYIDMQRESIASSYVKFN